jgi:hypothetical protein
VNKPAAPLNSAAAARANKQQQQRAQDALKELELCKVKFTFFLLTFFNLIFFFI